jgi:hypothetical protein
MSPRTKFKTTTTKLYTEYKVLVWIPGNTQKSVLYCAAIRELPRLVNSVRYTVRLDVNRSRTFCVAVVRDVKIADRLAVRRMKVRRAI